MIVQDILLLIRKIIVGIIVFLIPLFVVGGVLWLIQHWFFA
ncbi:hypothetical protein Cpin_5312 [Chitinophaga pinensis DSM 2588]|uniref:Uncharacterized protein n=1 Tax=Chitinophaga pinensis (strain ATCC 43595 / DSM 2588 / LMG 13176 / NBRC 15968 / NCIMB 11800 / UQM 2034) TaxID=485918 RepID=A0A979G8R4_CHIPD|nr:hypothetical protein Cpin_5312 [Chitinophaga pinensis DSM 2588]